MRFTDFLAFDAAAQAIYDDSHSQRKCRACLARISETARLWPGRFLAEAAKRDSRKGVAFKSKSLDDAEHAVFAQRLANRLPTKAPGGNYGDFLHHSVRSQGDVLGDMNWERWAVTKAALELGGIDPTILDDPNKSPAERLALVSQINWQNVTVPRLKSKLGPSFKVPDDWKRQYGIERLKKIKAAVDAGQPITDPQDRRLLGIWRTLEVQLGGDEGQPSQILSAGPKNDVGMTKLPMGLADRRRFYGALTGTTESVEGGKPLQLSPQSAYNYLTQYGVDVVSDEEATDLYLTRILHDLKSGNAFIPPSARGSEADVKRWRDSAARSWGGFLPAARSYDPGSNPGFAQWAAGMTTRGFKMRTNGSGRRVPAGYSEPEEIGRSSDVPGIKYMIDAPSQEVPNEEVNAFYRSGTDDANAAVELELMKPARDAVLWLRKKGWIDDPERIDDYVQTVVMGMLGRTGAIPNWRANIGFRRTTASMLARRFASQGWPSATKEKTGQLDTRQDDPGGLQATSSSNRQGGPDAFAHVQGGAARARQAIQKAIASIMDIDTTSMGADDEEKFVNSIDSLSDPTQAVRALDALDRISARHASALPQVRHAIDRIQRHLEPLMNKVRGDTQGLG
jgi:hypothetical protein